MIKLRGTLVGEGARFLRISRIAAVRDWPLAVLPFPPDMGEVA